MDPSVISVDTLCIFSFFIVIVFDATEEKEGLEMLRNTIPTERRELHSSSRRAVAWDCCHVKNSFVIYIRTKLFIGYAYNFNGGNLADFTGEICGIQHSGVFQLE